MRTKTIIFALILTLGILASACTKHTCPAYTGKAPAQTTKVSS